MSELPECKLCGCVPLNIPRSFECCCSDQLCALSMVPMSNEQWRTLMTKQAREPVAMRYTNDRALAECPCCGSLDVGGVHDTVNCYRCGLTITKKPPLKNAIDAWNKRALYTAPQAQPAQTAQTAQTVEPVGVVREFHVDWRGQTPPQGTQLYASNPKQLGPSLLEQSDLDFIAARLGRVAKRVGYPMPSGDSQFIVSVSGSILGGIASMLDKQQQSQPAPIPTDWRPIETAPEVKGDYFWCFIAWGPDGDQSTGTGFRWRGKWFAAGCFYRGGSDRQFEWQEIEVKPTHWQPLPPAPTNKENTNAKDAD